MSLTSLKISNFRNIKDIKLDFSSVCNVFFGENGSGKTSILEAIYYIGHGRSFRTHLPHRVINHDAKSFSLFSELDQKTYSIPIGIERSKISSQNKIRISGENLKSLADLAKLLPIQLLNHNSFQLIVSGPKFRRQFLDWGLFHVEQTFLQFWKNLNRALQQRNSALKSYSQLNDIKIWDNELITASNEIHLLRQNYIAKLIDHANKLLDDINSNYSVSIQYYPGWNIEHDLTDQLQSTINRDRKLGFTQCGAHRADLLFKVNDAPAADILSRGQLKVLFFTLQIAQAILLTELTNKKCLYLIDDLPAELDKTKRDILLNIISKTESQTFITALNPNDLQLDFFTNHQMFHVEHGNIIGGNKA